jgi:glycosyltransferase involved in cell wall biosynthesis
MHHKDNPPSISVLVPIFNEEHLIYDCLLSLKSQSYENFEVIVSDDASTNSTGEIARQICNEDQRFHYFRNSRNVGMTQNWNAALKKATGKYVMKLDGDDQFTPDTLRLMMLAAEENASSIVFCRTLDCDENLKPIGPYIGENAFQLASLNPAETHLKNGLFWYSFCFDDYQIWHSNAFLVNASLLRAVSGWDERCGCASDTDLILRLLELNIVTLSIPHVGVLYRHRKGSVSDIFRSKNMLAIEGEVILLSSIHRHMAKGGKINKRLASNWYRIWRNWQEHKKSIPHSVGPDNVPHAWKIECNGPPLTVRITRELYELCSRTRRLLWSIRDLCWSSFHKERNSARS